MTVPATSVAQPARLRLTWQPCRCCRDLPPYLSCDRSADAACDVCGWAARYQDVDDAPDACPQCGGTGITDPAVRATCLEWDGFVAESLPRVAAIEAEIARLERMNPVQVAALRTFADLRFEGAGA